jgi:hypothetical protein
MHPDPVSTVPTNAVLQTLLFIRRQVEEKRTQKNPNQIIAVMFVSAGATYHLQNIGPWGEFLRMDLGNNEWILAHPASGHFTFSLETIDTPSERREIGFTPA